MDLHGKTFFIYNKKYHHARIAQWGTGSRQVGTYEEDIYPDQLWYIEEDTKYRGFYYIKNAFREGYRLAKWGTGDTKAGVYTGKYYEDQLWKFKKEGDHYRIYNKKHTSSKITKWGKDNSDWGTYDGPDYEDQLWKLVPRFVAKQREDIIWSMKNSGSQSITKEFTITTGLKLTSSKSISVKFGFESSIKASAEGNVGAAKVGAEAQNKFSFGISPSMSQTTEETWSKSTTTKYTAPPGKLYKITQTLVDFSSPHSVDNCCLYCEEEIQESDIQSDS